MSDKSKSDQSISVIIRIKGNTTEELKEKSSLLKVTNNNSIIIDSKKKEFFYDYVGNEYTTQKDIFEQCGKKICDYSLEGYNGTIFAYGQTGSGKTYTLLGKNITSKLENKNNNMSNNNYSMITTSEDIEMNEDNNLNQNNEFYYDINDETIGLLPRILYYLFKNSSKTKKEENKFTFKISYLEIYKENLMDLLYPDNKEKVQLSDINGILNLKNLRKLIIDSPEEAIKYIIDGNHFRHTASTLMNSESSRSHAIISIYIENKMLKDNKIKKSVFHIIDLAGSERQKKTGTSGDRTKEAGAINKSLLNLSIVIQKIINNQKPIPYRDSKLTHLLRDSLGGNAKTSIIATISKLDSNLEETISTLNFAQNAKKIKNNAIINEELSANEAKILKEKFKNLQINYNTIFKKYSDLQKEYQIQRNSINEKEIISKSLESQNEDINRMMKDILEKEENLKKIKEENDNLKDKIEKDDIEFKLKDKEIKEMKQKINSLNEENKILSKENNQFKNKLSSFEKKISLAEKTIKNMEEIHRGELLKMEENCKNLKSKNICNEEILNLLKEKIKSYEEQLQEDNKQMINLKKIIEEKDKNINDMSNIIFQNENKNKELNNSINEFIAEIKEKKDKLNEASKNNEEIKTKGKEILKKYDEILIKYKDEINKNKEEIKTLKQTISQNYTKMTNINRIISSMEEEKELINKKLESSRKNISDYLDVITLLHQQIINVEAEKKEILKEKEEINKKLTNLYIPNVCLNPFNRNNQMNKNNNISNNAECIKLKKENEKLKNNYENLIKAIEPKDENEGNKIRKIEELVDKVNLSQQFLGEYKNIIKDSIKKLGEYIDVNNNKEKKISLKNKFELVIQSLIDFINKKNFEIEQLNEEKEILLNNINTNNIKKSLFDILNVKNNNSKKEENIHNDLFNTIKKIREKEGYLSKITKDKNKINNNNNKIIQNFDLFFNDENKNKSNYNCIQGENKNNSYFNFLTKFTQ